MNTQIAAPSTKTAMMRWTAGMLWFEIASATPPAASTTAFFAWPKTVFHFWLMSAIVAS